MRLVKRRMPVESIKNLECMDKHHKDERLIPKNEKVLVVDDEDDTRLLLRLILERHGVSVVDARDGLQALEMVQRDKSKEISTVITDYRMPRMNGAQLCKEIRHTYSYVKDVFLITAYLSKTETDNLKGFTRTFEKPLDIDAIVSAIDHNTNSP